MVIGAVDENGLDSSVEDNSTNVSEETDIDTDVVSEEDNEIDEATASEVEVMDVSHGAEMRLLQLEWRIRRAILHGEAVIRVISAKGNETAELEAIIEQLNALIDEVRGISTVKGDQDAVNKFVEVKKDAIDLVKEFRDKARVLLDAEDKESLRAEFQEIDRGELQELKEQIMEKRRMLNAIRVRAILGHLGEEDNELIEKVESGEVNANEVIDDLKARFRAMASDIRTEAREKIKEERIEKRDMRIERIRIAKAERIENRAVRLESRADRLERAGFENAGSRLRARASNVREVSR